MKTVEYLYDTVTVGGVKHRYRLVHWLVAEMLLGYSRAFSRLILSNLAPINEVIIGGLLIYTRITLLLSRHAPMHASMHACLHPCMQASQPARSQPARTQHTIFPFSIYF